MVLGYSPTRLICFLHGAPDEQEDQLALGYKGYSLKRLCSLGMPVPPGFVVSTELFDIQGALDYQDLERDTKERIAGALERLEEITGLTRNDPEAAAGALGALGLGVLHARDDGHHPQRRAQRAPARGHGRRQRARLGRLGLLSALPAERGHVVRRRPRSLRRRDDPAQGEAPGRCQAPVHRRADEGDGARVPRGR